jgi:hypothetical protein
MEEDEYRDTYDTVNERRCVFEKAINSRRATCAKSLRFHLADREGITCRSASGNALCAVLLPLMRAKARFALHLTSAEGPLPHAKEIRVQTGGLLGLQGEVYPDRQGQDGVEDIIDIVDVALRRHGTLEDLPYDAIVQAIVRFEGRKRRRHRHEDD